MIKLLGRFFLLSHLSSLLANAVKSQVWDFRPPICYRKPCTMRNISTKIYIDDDLHQKMESSFGESKAKAEIIDQIEKAFKKVNKLLADLDNGGYHLDFNKQFTKLSQSDVKFGKTYVDRMDDNKTKEADPNSLSAMTFLFQEAVEKLSNRQAVDIRILFTTEKVESDYLAFAEEKCICNPTWFGCVACLTVPDIEDWSLWKSAYAHEIGHSLGMVEHDDMVYNNLGREGRQKLLMMASVYKKASIWSPVSKKRINERDHSCLKKQGTDYSMDFFRKILPKKFLVCTKSGCSIKHSPH